MVLIAGANDVKTSGSKLLLDLTLEDEVSSPAKLVTRPRPVQQSNWPTISRLSRCSKGPSVPTIVTEKYPQKCCPQCWLWCFSGRSWATWPLWCHCSSTGVLLWPEWLLATVATCSRSTASLRLWACDHLTSQCLKTCVRYCPWWLVWFWIAAAISVVNWNIGHQPASGKAGGSPPISPAIGDFSSRKTCVPSVKIYILIILGQTINVVK